MGIEVTVKAEDIAGLTDLLGIVESYNVKGGPAPAEVKRAIVAREKSMVLVKSNISRMKEALEKAKKKLESAVKTCSGVTSSENGRFKNSKL